MRAASMQMVADRCGLHVSTVSRAISGKSFLFQGAEHPIASLLRHDGNHALGATDIQQTLETIIRDEDPTHPYSDAALQRLLAKADIVLSRRTVAKYREASARFPAHPDDGSEPDFHPAPFLNGALT
ncbi:MAG: hypothetical protein ACLVJ6_02350 [Merdibacter sp.]